MCLTGIFIMLIRIKCLIPVRGGYVPIIMVVPVKRGHSGWLNDNLKEAENAPEFYGVTAKWTFNGKWDPEQRIRDLWNVLAY